MECSVYVKVEDNVVAFGSDAVYLAAESAVETSGVYFLVFEELAFGDGIAEGKSVSPIASQCW